MKKKFLTIFILATLVLCLLLPQVAYAAPYGTWALGPNGTIVATQTAYEPQGKLSISKQVGMPLSSPEDMTYDETTKLVYIADTKNKRVVVMSLDNIVVSEIGLGQLAQPVGLAVDDERLYVCDKELKQVVVYDKTTGSFLYAINKPSSPLVGANTPFVPVKIAVDGRENMYVVSEGCVSGLMQLNMAGEFLGFVGANETTASVSYILKDLLYSEEQKNTFLAAPRSPTNVSINSRGLLYTVTNGASSNAVKKLNTLGNAIMSPNTNYSDAMAVAIDDAENIFIAGKQGYISVFDSYGDLLFRFGGADSDERLGSLASPVAVEVCDNGDLLVLDSTYAMVIIYSRTDFANLVLKAVEYYKDGLYLEGKADWERVLQLNGSFVVSYKALARANMKEGNYDLALQQFRLAEDREGYSEAFWQIRNEWLQNNLIWVILLLLGVIAVVIVLKFVDKRKPKLFAPVKAGIGKVTSQPVIKGLLHTRRFLKSPQDAVFEVKYHGAASVWSAGILYVWFVVLQILSLVVTGYLFNPNSVYGSNGWQMVLTSTLVLLLLVVCNYFVSTVTDGEGKLKHCFVTIIYGIAPYLVLALPVFILSNALTFNENVVWVGCQIVMYAWAGINLFRTIMELHDYTVGQALKNVLLTLFAFAMALLFVVVLRMLVVQFFGYFAEVIKELINNVF